MLETGIIVASRTLLPTTSGSFPDNQGMHLLIPFAFCRSEGCVSALRKLKLPQLEKLLARLTPLAPDSGDEFSLSPPHERALARALNLPTEDGLIPWAALQAQSLDGAWGFITPCHWQMGSGHIAMSGPELPDFPAHESHALLAAMQPFFKEDGIALQFDRAQRWLARGDALQGLPTASLDRVAGRDVTCWMPDHPRAAKLQRLQSEMQMLLYTHPVNQARTERGVPTVNSFWISGTGPLPDSFEKATLVPPPLIVTTLRDAALSEDWTAWAQAWHHVDATQCVALLAALDQSPHPNPLAAGEGVKSRHAAITLTLCGERNAQTFRVQAQTYWKRLMNIFDKRQPSTLLEQL